MLDSIIGVNKMASFEYLIFEDINYPNYLFFVQDSCYPVMYKFYNYLNSYDPVIKVFKKAFSNKKDLGRIKNFYVYFKNITYPINLFSISETDKQISLFLPGKLQSKDQDVDHVTVSKKDNGFSIHYTGLNHSRPKKIRSNKIGTILYNDFECCYPLSNICLDCSLNKELKKSKEFILDSKRNYNKIHLMPKILYWNQTNHLEIRIRIIEKSQNICEIKEEPPKLGQKFLLEKIVRLELNKVFDLCFIIYLSSGKHNFPKYFFAEFIS